jgi:hypothetical protein
MKNSYEKLLDTLRRSISVLDDVDRQKDKYERGLPYFLVEERDRAYEQFGEALNEYIAEALKATHPNNHSSHC